MHVELREKPTEDGTEVRYFELRFDGEREISGTAIRYGDVAVIFGEKERFEPGSFGDVSTADAIMNVMHERARPIARTGGGGMIVDDNGIAVSVRATLPETQDANDTLALVRSKVLRGLSVEFRAKKWRYEGPEKDQTRVIEEAELRGVGVVDRPAYPGSRINPRVKPTEENEMDEAEVRKIVEEALSKRDGDAGLDQEALISTLTEAWKADRSATEDSVKGQIAAAFTERDEARAAEHKADEDRRATETKAEEDRKATETQTEEERKAFEAEAERKADLRVTFASLYPEGFDARGKSSKELLVAAVGTEVEGAENRSEDYLLGKAEAILERHAEALKNAPNGGAGDGGGTRPVTGADDPRGIRFLGSAAPHDREPRKPRAYGSRELREIGYGDVRTNRIQHQSRSRVCR